MVMKRLILAVAIFIFPVLSSAGEREPNNELITNQNGYEENVLFFDENIPGDKKNYFFDIKESKRLRPKPSDFEILHFAPMSNKNGERWVLITVKNNAGGHRILKNEHVVAIFANGSQANPVRLNESIDGGQTISKAISFGVWRFPVVTIETQP